jgi:hypothetical protein
MSKKYREDAIVPQIPAGDYTAKKGYLVDLAAGTATISSSGTTPAKGVILEGNDTVAGYAAEAVTVAILGATKGTVPMRCGGTIAAGALVCQSTDGTIITDAGSGARVAVGIALEAGTAGENIEVAPITPRIYAS